jgi:hypothetical protein
VTLKEIGEEAVKGRLSLLRHFDSLDGRFTGLRMLALGPGVYGMDVIAEAERIRLLNQRKLADCKTYVIPEDDRALDILDQDVKTFPTATIYESDMLSPNGFVYLGRPVRHPVPELEIPPIRAFSWYTVPPDDPDMGKDDGYMMVITIYTATREMPFEVEKREIQPRLYSTSTVMWQIGHPDGGMPWKDPKKQAEARRYREPMAKLIGAFFAVIRQRLLVVENHSEPILPKKVSHMRRRYPRMESGVQVVRLRPRPERRAVATQGESGRKVSVHFTVGSFWRWQWYPRTEENKPILIESYDKGPRHLPLTGVHRAFAPPKPLRPRS